MSQISETANHTLDVSAARSRALVVGVVGLALCAVGALLSPEQFFRSYLLGYLYWIGITLGCLVLMMLHHLSGGAWGFAIRRVCEAATRTFPVMVVLFLPIVVGMQVLYVWARPEAGADEILRHKSAYLNVPFFLGRAALYFLVWTGLSWGLNRWSLEQDRTGDVALQRKMQLFSGPGVVIFFLTVSFAAVDWIMSLEPHWFSTIFGALWIVGSGLNGFAFAIVVVALVVDKTPVRAVLGPDVYHDLGKLLLAFVMLWAYFSFSQYIIIWAGNLPEEIPFYLDRSRGGWQWVALSLIFIHFALPFTLLLSRDLKRSARRLVVVALIVVVMRFVDIAWVVIPSFTHEHMRIHWLDVAAPVGIGGLWIWLFLTQLRGRPLLPVNDPYIEEALANGGHGH